MFGDLFQLLQNLNALRPMWALLGVVKCTVRSSLLHAIFISLVFALLICIWVVALVSEAFLGPFLTSVCPLVLICDALSCSVLVDDALMLKVVAWYC